jgi:hypothetical protein
MINIFSHPEKGQNDSGPSQIAEFRVRGVLPMAFHGLGSAAETMAPGVTHEAMAELAPPAVVMPESSVQPIAQEELLPLAKDIDETRARLSGAGTLDMAARRDDLDSLRLERLRQNVNDAREAA